HPFRPLRPLAAALARDHGRAAGPGRCRRPAGPCHPHRRKPAPWPGPGARPAQPGSADPGRLSPAPPPDQDLTSVKAPRPTRPQTAPISTGGMSMNRVKGKVCIVTGGALGIGRACAERLAEEGAAVAVFDLHGAEGEAVCAGIRERGGQARYWRVDVADEAAVKAAIDDVAATFGG